MIIDSCLYNQDSQPRSWLISKVNRISPDGIVRVTLAQDTFDQHNDYIERDEEGNIIGMWANYYKSNIEPTFIPDESDSQQSGYTSRITCSGKPQFKIGGSAKTFTVTFYDSNGQEIDRDTSVWGMSMDNAPVPISLIERTVDGNKVKIKFLGDDSYIGKILTVTNTSGIITSSIDVEIIAL